MYFPFIKLTLAVMRQMDHGRGTAARTDFERSFQKLWQPCRWRLRVAGLSVHHGDDEKRSSLRWSVKTELRGLAEGLHGVVGQRRNSVLMCEVKVTT